MNIKQLEQQTGMTRANIRFYEQQGLIAPNRLDNKYRDYSQTDLDALKKIKLLRALEVSIDEIKRLQCKSEALCDVLERKIILLEQKQLLAQTAKELCVVIKDDNVTYENLSAEKYMQKTVSCKIDFLNQPLPDGEKHAFCPWRRFFARTLDLALYTVLWQIILEFVFKTSFTALSEAAFIINFVMPIIFMLILEPVCIYLFKTTLGKFILGLRLEPKYADKISFSDARSRTFGVVLSGYGLFVPGYSIYRLYKSYSICFGNEHLPWDNEFCYTIKDESPKRNYVYVGICGILLVMPILITLTARLPQNRGPLTISEYAQNYNTLSTYYGFDLVYSLDEDGQFVNDTSGTVINVFDIQKPVFDYVTDENGKIKELSFSISDSGADFAPMYRYEMLLSALSFAGAQKSVNAFSPFIGDIANIIDSNLYNSYSYTYKNIEIICNYELIGYDIAYNLDIASAQNEASSYKIDFKIKLIN